MVRGFLNDGSTDYSSHHSVDSLAFGHCAYSYRNLGRPSQVKLRQDKSTFKVEVDGKVCFETPSVRLPAGYSLGVTAVSAETPDSVEIFKITVMTDSHSPEAPPESWQQSQQQTPPEQQSYKEADATNDPPEIPAEAIEQARQFADVHNRLQAVFRHIGSLQRDIKNANQKAEDRHSELMVARTVPFEQLNAMERRLEGIEKAVYEIKAEVGNKEYLRLHSDLKKTLQDSHTTLLEGMAGRVGHAITSSAPRLGFFIFVILASQLLLAVSYVVYKRRRSMAPKKYL